MVKSEESRIRHKEPSRVALYAMSVNRHESFGSTVGAFCTTNLNNMFIPWWGIIAIIVALIFIWGIYGSMIGDLSSRVDNLEEKADEDENGRPDFND